MKWFEMKFCEVKWHEVRTKGWSEYYHEVNDFLSKCNELWSKEWYEIIRDKILWSEVTWGKNRRLKWAMPERGGMIWFKPLIHYWGSNIMLYVWRILWTEYSISLTYKVKLIGDLSILKSVAQIYLKFCIDIYSI